MDSTGDVGRYTSITLGADGRGQISYYDAANSDLKVLHCSYLTCSNSYYNIYLPLVLKNF